MSDPRMVSGPAISTFIFFRVTAAIRRPEGLSAALSVDARHEIWLESTGEPLDALAGRLDIILAPAAAAREGRLARGPGKAYALTLHVAHGWEALAARLLDAADPPVLMVEFDAEYKEGWDSPAGYSAAYGVQYWDDVMYPDVEVAGFVVE